MHNLCAVVVAVGSETVCLTIKLREYREGKEGERRKCEKNEQSEIEYKLSKSPVTGGRSDPHSIHV